MPARLGGVEGHAACLRHLLSDSFNLLALQCGDEVPWQHEGSLGFALGMAGLDQPLDSPVEGPRYLPAEAGLDERRASAGDQLAVEPGRAVATDLLFEVEGRKGADLKTVSTSVAVVGRAPLDDVGGDAPVVGVDPIHMAGTA